MTEGEDEKREEKQIEEREKSRLKREREWT